MDGLVGETETTMVQRRSAGGATIRDVAREADVSVATVSRVLRDSEVVTEKTRDRVRAVIERLSFTPSRAARSLAEQRHAANGIVFPDLSGPYFAEVVLGYEDVAASRGRSVLILSTHGRDAAPDMVLELATRVDGLVVLGRTVADEVVAEVRRRGIPVVLLARPEPSGQDADLPPVDVVQADNVASAALLADHLLADGHADIAFAGDPAASPDVGERWHSLRDRVAADSDAHLRRLDAGFGEDEGAALAGRLLDQGSLPDVLVCANDELALGALQVLRQAGVAVPGDVAVTGWDDVMAARYAGLTTVRQPMRELGGTAADLLDARIADPSRPSTRHVLPTEVVVRDTCHAGTTRSTP